MICDCIDLDVKVTIKTKVLSELIILDNSFAKT